MKMQFLFRLFLYNPIVNTSLYNNNFYNKIQQCEINKQLIINNKITKRNKKILKGNP